MSKETVRKFFSGIGIAFAAFPLLVLLLFYAYVIRARLDLGYWPSYSHPKSYRMGFALHYALLRPWFLVFPLGGILGNDFVGTGFLPPFLVALYDGALWAVFRKFPKWPFIAFDCSAFIVYVWRFTDPGKFIDWFLD